MKITQTVITDLVISPEEIQSGDITGITDRFSASVLPIGDELRSHLGSLRISAIGLPNPSLVFEQENFRRYFAKLFTTWNEWMFLLDLDHRDVRPLLLTKLSRSAYLVREDEDRRSLQVLTTDIFEQLIKPAGVVLWKLCREAEMTEQEFRARYHAVLVKFGIKTN